MPDLLANFRIWTKPAPTEAGFGDLPNMHRQGIRQRILVISRWVAIVGQTTTILLVHFVFQYEYPAGTALIIVAVSSVMNLYLSVRHPASKRLSEIEAAAYLVYDVLQIGALLYLTGGLHNPFAFLGSRLIQIQ